ncbi:MAG: GlsB/YeaQ/YmgE family stress response membrane protein [Acidimicrobiales bacterium]
MLLALVAVLVLLFVVLPIVGLALWAFLSTVVVGLIIGAVARLVIPGAQPIGLLATILCGLSGSILGGFLGQHVFGVGRFATVLLEIVVAAVAVLLITRARGRRLRVH